MKKIVVFLVLLIASLSYGQSQSIPQFEKCKSVTDEQKQDCFLSTVKENIKSRLSPNILNEKGNASAIFVVDTIGQFKLVYVETSSSKIKQEIEAIFSQFEPVQPAFFNKKAITTSFTLNLKFPLVELEKTKAVSKKIDPENITAKTDLKEYEVVKNEKFKYDNYQSGLLIPFNHILYSDFDANINLVGSNNHTASKPLSYREVSNYYDFTHKHQLYKNKTSKWGRKLWNEHLVAFQGNDYWFVFNPIFDFRTGKDFSNESSNIFVNTRGFNFYGGLGKRISFTTSVYESQGRFASYYNQYIVSLKPSGGNPGTVPGVGIAKDFRGDGFDFPMAEANLKFTADKFIDIQLGYGRNFIGDGYRSVLQGDGTSPYPFIKMNTTFWKIKYTNTYMFLRDITPAQTAEDTYASKYMANHYLSWNATKRLNIGLFESVVWSNSNGRGFDPNFINPIIFYRAVEFASSPKSGNALLGLTAKYKWNSVFHTYGQFLVDEFSVSDVSAGNKSWKNKFGYQIGGKYFNAFGVKNLQLQLEYNIVRPYVYSHSNTLTNYAHNNQSMGHNWGSNFRELISITRYQKNRWYGQAKMIYGVKGFDYKEGANYLNYGSDLFLSYDDENHPRANETGAVVGQGNKTTIVIADLTAGYLVNPSSNMRVYCNFIYRNFKPMVNTATTQAQQTTWFSIGLTTELFNWYFDY